MAIAVRNGRVRGRGGGLLQNADSCGHVAFQNFSRSAQNTTAHNRECHLVFRSNSLSTFFSFSSIFASFSYSLNCTPENVQRCLSLRFLLLNSFCCFYCNAHLTTGFFGRCTTKKCFSFILVRFNLLHFYFCMGKLFFRFLWGFESFLKIVFFLLGRKHNRSLKRSNSF